MHVASHRLYHVYTMLVRYNMVQFGMVRMMIPVTFAIFSVPYRTKPDHSSVEIYLDPLVFGHRNIVLV